MNSALEIARNLQVDLGTLHGVNLQFEHKATPTPVPEGAGLSLEPADKQPWEMSKAEFETRFPRLQDIPADKQHEILDMVNATNSNVEGAEPLSFEQFTKDFHDMRFDPESGETTMQPEHEDFVVEAFKNHYSIPDEVRAEYKEKLDQIEARKSSRRNEPRGLPYPPSNLRIGSLQEI